MKEILIGLGLFAAGFAVGHIVTKKLVGQHYEDLLQEEIASIKEHLGKTVRTQPPVNQPNEDNGVKPPEAALARSSILPNRYEQAKTAYHLVGKDSELASMVPPRVDDADVVQFEDPDEVAIGEENIDMAEERDLGDIDRTLPYLITEEEFSDEFEHHDKLSMYYYKVDDVLTDDGEEIVDDIEEICGYDALTKLDMQTMVWVRNEPLAIDYEIIAINKSYNEMKYGYGVAESPRERYSRLKAGEKGADDK